MTTKSYLKAIVLTAGLALSSCKGNEVYQNPQKENPTSQDFSLLKRLKDRKVNYIFIFNPNTGEEEIHWETVPNRSNNGIEQFLDF